MAQNNVIRIEDYKRKKRLRIYNYCGDLRPNGGAFCTRDPGHDGRHIGERGQWWANLDAARGQENAE